MNSNEGSGGEDRRDGELYYTDLSVVGYEEKYSKQGTPMHYTLTIKTTMFEHVDSEEDVELSAEEFEMRVKPTERENVRVQRFMPLRSDEPQGIHLHEFELFWECVGEFESRGFNVDTGCMEFAGGSR